MCKSKSFSASYVEIYTQDYMLHIRKEKSSFKKGFIFPTNEQIQEVDAY